MFPASSSSLAALSDRTAALAQHGAMRASLHEVGRVLDEESIDAHFTRGGTISLARNPAQLARARAEVDEARSWGRGEDEIRLLDADDASDVLAGSSVHGATYTPDCAAVHPLRLVRGLADTVVRLGVRLFEHTPVTSIGPGRLVTSTGVVRADTVVRATEGYTVEPRRRASASRADLLARHRHGAARRGPVGADRAAIAARPSPTTVT